MKRLLVLILFAVLAWQKVARSDLNLAWDPSPDTNVAGYILYYGTNSGQYFRTNVMGPVSNCTVSDLVFSGVYYFAVTAYSPEGLQSDFSNELCLTNCPMTGPPSNRVPCHPMAVRFLQE